MHRGYIKLWRRIEDTAIFDNSHAVHVFLYLLVNASRHDRYVIVGSQKIELKSGQLVTGRKAISKATGINESKIFRVLKLLKSEQLIEQQASNKFSIISITNWSSYQNTEQQTEQQVNNNRTTSEHKQEVKEVKNKKPTPSIPRKQKQTSAFLLPKWVPSEEWDGYVEMRSKIKKPMTDRAKRLAVKKLEELEKQGSLPGEVLDQSVLNCWQGLFAVKDQYQGTTSPSALTPKQQKDEEEWNRRLPPT